MQDNLEYKRTCNFFDIQGFVHYSGRYAFKGCNIVDIRGLTDLAYGLILLGATISFVPFLHLVGGYFQLAGLVLSFPMIDYALSYWLQPIMPAYNYLVNYTYGMGLGSYLIFLAGFLTIIGGITFLGDLKHRYFRKYLYLTSSFLTVFMFLTYHFISLGIIPLWR